MYSHAWFIKAAALSFPALSSSHRCVSLPLSLGTCVCVRVHVCPRVCVRVKEIQAVINSGPTPSLSRRLCCMWSYLNGT